MFKFVFAILVSMIAFSASVNVRKCKNGQPLPLSVEFEGCSQPPCKVVKGKTAVMNINFLGNKDNITSLNAKVKPFLMGFPVPYALPTDQANVCSNLLNGGSCPISKNEEVVYKLNLFVNTKYPDIPLVVLEVSLNDENDVSVACFMCNIKVKRGSIN